MLDTAGKFGVPEASVPKFHNSGTFLWRDVWLVDVTFCFGKEVFFRREPSGLVDAFDGGRVMSLGEATDIVLEIVEWGVTVVGPEDALMGGGFHCVKCQVRDAGFCSLSGKLIGTIVASKARVAADF